MQSFLDKEEVAQIQDSPKALARWLFTQVMERVDVSLSVRGAMSLVEQRLHVGPHSFDLSSFRQVLLVSIGKAAVPMAQQVIETMNGSLPLEGVVVGVGEWIAPEGVRYIQGDHPVPYEKSFAAASACLQLLSGADEQTLALYLISGGASAMVEAPLDPAISLQDLSAFYTQILYSGLPIDKANVLRKHFSAVKGGRLAMAAHGATRCTVLISDVPVGRLDFVGSGPSLADSSTAEECLRLLAETPAFAELPRSISEFARRMPETPKQLPEGRAESISIALLSSDSLIEAAEPLLVAAGYRILIDHTCDDWDYVDAAKYLVDRALTAAEEGWPVCILSAGEVTVSIRTKAGVGGRNQQWALEVARLIDGVHGLVAMSVGSDGIDGNSPAAGAIVDEMTWQRARAAGIDPYQSLHGFNAYPLFAALKDTVMSGPSGNNIRDLRILLVNRKFGKERPDV